MMKEEENVSKGGEERKQKVRGMRGKRKGGDKK